MWLGLCGLAYVNGAFREIVLKNSLGMIEPWANQLSCLTGVIVWSVFTIGCWSRLKIKTWSQASFVGLGWFLATLSFETFILERKLSWSQVLLTFDLSAGQLWSLVLIWIGLMPLAFFSVIRFRHLINNWGATPFEQSEPIAGVEFLRGPHIHSTQALTIDSSPQEIWPWLVQMGEGRGGFYSYSWLENRVGCNIHNATHIIPALQGIQQGDSISLHSRAPKLKVTVLDVNHTIAFEGWIFHLQEIGNEKTRLISRVYTEKKPHQGFIYNFVMKSFLFDLAHFIMTRRQLLTIKALCEA